jgi:diaminohydroxyphosphoribosylaminopyrimidine deaminase/5-amino-6-(5-phosphoribosylamino)uracil reductase
MNRQTAPGAAGVTPDDTFLDGRTHHPPGAIVPPADDTDALWSMCLAVAERRRRGLPPCALAVDPRDAGARTGEGRALRPRRPPGSGLELVGAWSEAARAMFDLYRPLLELAPGQRYLLGHLGQSLDGRIATRSGDSCFINGQENLIHMHRLRALCDAVLVGAGTVIADDPQLTTRLVPGPHATRVVLDPSMRLTGRHRICADSACPTLVARFDASRGTAQPAAAAGASCGMAEIIAVVPAGHGIDLPDLLDALAERGLRAILVEGGGITVSRFLARGLLDRLQIAIAPVIIGSGRQGLQLPEVLALSDCLRPPCRHHQMGPDVLWDLDLAATG